MLGVCSLLPKRNEIIFIIVGFILVFITLGLILRRNFLQSYRNKIITAALIYNGENKSIVIVPYYNFAKDVYKYLDGAIFNSMLYYLRKMLEFRRIFSSAPQHL